MSRRERVLVGTIAGALALAGCDGGAPSAPAGACDQLAWVEPSDPLLVTIRASGALSWDAETPPADALTTRGTLASVEGTTSTTLHFETGDGPLRIEIALPPATLGVLPIERELEVTLGDGVVLADDEGRIVAAVVSRRASEARALSLTFRQEYPECLRTFEVAGAGCVHALAAPLVDVVTGASVVRLPPGGVWRIPDDDDPSVEIEIVRSIRQPTPGELTELPEGTVVCTDAPAQELAAIVRHLR